MSVKKSLANTVLFLDNMWTLWLPLGQSHLIWVIFREKRLILVGKAVKMLNLLANPPVLDEFTLESLTHYGFSKLQASISEDLQTSSEISKGLLGANQ